MKIKFNSPVILYFSFAAALVFIINMLTSGYSTGLFVLHGNFSFTNIGNYLTLFTYILGHSSISHLVGNLTFILLLGPVLEEKYGSKMLLLMIAITALITAISNLLLFSNGILGASGIVYLFIILVSFVNTERGSIPLTFLIVFILFIGKELFNGLQDDNISQFSHIIGGVCGGFFGFYHSPDRKKRKDLLPVD